MTLKKRRKFQTDNDPNEWIVRQREARQRVISANDPTGPFGDAPADQDCAPEEVMYRVIVCSGSGGGGDGCIETFTRTESGQWGTSEFGVGDWQHTGDGDWEVDGDEGLQTQTGFTTNPRSFLDGLAGRYSLPIELLFSVVWADVGDFIAIESGDGADAFWAVTVEGGSPVHISAEIANAGDGGFDDMDLAFDINTGEFPKVWVRALIEDEAISLKVWLDTDPEPGSYDLVVNVPGLGFSGDAPNMADIFFQSQGAIGDAFKFDDIEWVSGFECEAAAEDCWQIINAMNDEVGTIDSAGVITSIDLDLDCPLSLVSDAIVSSGTLYDIPTDAQYITDVWFDYLHATKEEHWTFEAPRSINVLSPISAETVVRVAFVTDVT